MEEAQATVTRLKELRFCTTLEKKKHYNAADRKRTMHHWLGVASILMNLVLGSVLVVYLRDVVPNIVKWGGAVLALGAALISGLTTFFKYQQEAEGHVHVADSFLALACRCRTAIAGYEDGLLQGQELRSTVEAIEREYNELIASASPLPTTDNDYLKAKEGMAKGEETYTEQDLDF